MTDTVFELMVDIQNALEDSDDEPPSASAPGAAAPGDAAPGDESLTSWAQQAYLSVADEDSEVTIRLVGEAEMAELNKTYRNKDGTTNVLSFPVDAEIEIPLLGDIVICHQVIVREAHEQNKNLHDHYAHMVTHGVLHLCGYDHNNDAEAEEMEALEVDVLAQSNIANPYN